MLRVTLILIVIPFQVLPIITDVGKTIEQTKTECKSLLLDFVIKCRNRSISQEINSLCTSILIRAACDKDLQDPALQFWNSFLPSSVSERFSSVVKLYSPDMDDVFLKAVTIILISLGEVSASYQSPMFLQPLATDLSWQDQDISGTLNFEQKKQGVIRATQKTFQFSQTQADQFSSKPKSVVRIPRGFLSRTPGGTQRTLSYSELATARMRYQKKLQSQQARSKAIHLVRNYRVGELPDIQLPFKDLLGPMSAIAKSSESFASFVLQAILHDEEFQCQREIGTMLEKTSNQFLAKFCIELCLKRSYIINEISTTAIKHHQYNLGILWAEEAISQSSESVPDWTDLCRLYGAIGDHDSILGIRKHHLKSDPGLLEAVTAMSHKNFAVALKKFQELGNPPIEDTLQCMLNLCQWSEIESKVDEIPPSPQSAYLKLSCMAQSVDSVTLDDLENLVEKFENNFQVESYGLLALLFNLKENGDKALAYVYNAIECFLQQWRLSQQNIQKNNVLFPLQTLAELYDVVDKQGQLSSQWNSCFPEEITTPLPAWHHLINQRSLLSRSKIVAEDSSCSFSDSLMEDDDDGISNEPNGKHRLIFSAAKSALRQNSACIAKKLIQQLDVTELNGMDLSHYYDIGTDVVIRTVEDNTEDVSATDRINQLERMLNILNQDQKVSAGRLKLKMAELLYKNPSSGRHDPADMFAQGMRCLTDIDCASLDVSY